MMVRLQGTKLKDFSDDKYENVVSSIKDMEVLGIYLGWLREYLDKVRSTKTLCTSYFKIKTSEAQIAEAREKYEQLLTEAQAKISVLEAIHELLVKEHQVVEAAPKVTLSVEEPILPQVDLIAQKLSE